MTGPFQQLLFALTRANFVLSLMQATKTLGTSSSIESQRITGRVQKVAESERKTLTENQTK
jgi:hypothetical protein